MNPRSNPRPTGRNQRGYVLLTLLVMMAVLILAAAAVAPAISFQIRRDREEELIHRGVQYSRAIRNYYKKFGRYPTRIEELENTNNLRFLRKRYKDPITGQDFKLLHFGEVKLTFSAPLAGASNLNSPGSLNGPSPLNSPGGFGPQVGSTSGGTFGSSQSGLGSSSKLSSDQSSSGTGDQNQTAGANQSAPSSGQPDSSSSGSSSKDQLSGRVFGGGPIVGVISTSKKRSIREFNHKNKYSEWQFIYDPATDRGGLLSTPNQPPLQGFGNQPGQTGQPGSTSPFGAQPGQGNYPGQTNPNPPNTGPGTQPPPSDSPNQQ